MLRRNKIKGIVNVNLLIGKDGKAKLMHIEMHEPTFAFEGMEPWYRIEKYVCPKSSGISFKSSSKVVFGK